MRAWPSALLLLLALARPASAQSGTPAPVAATFDWLPSMLTVYDGRLYFRADPPGKGGRSLWAYDAATGQAGAVLPIDPFNEGRAPNMAVYDGRLFFGAHSPDGGWSDLIAYDAATGGHVGYDLDTLITGINSLTVLDGRLYFVAGLRSPVGNCGTSTQLWAFDAATEQGAPVTALCPGLWDGSGRSLLVPYAGRLFFQADDGMHGRELWAYDPATETASLVEDVAPGVEFVPYYLTVYDGRLFFTGSTNRPVDGTDLWAYDAATGVIEEVADIGAPGYSPPVGLTVYDGRLFFAHGDAATGSELWVYDAATGTAGLVAEIGPGSFPGAPRQFAVYNDVLYFNAIDGVHGMELWAYDAPTDSVRQVADLNSTGSADPSSLTVYDGRLYFSALGDVPGAYLWSLETPTTAEEEPRGAAAPLVLGPAHPNPSGTSATLTLTVAVSQPVRVEAFDVLGRSAAVLHDGPVSAGVSHELRLDASALTAGVYVVRATGAAGASARAVTVPR
jgi:ELWxxDGT repeat protein